MRALRQLAISVIFAAISISLASTSNAFGAVSPNSLPQTQQAKLLAADRASMDYFGYSVALSADGAVALVGAFYKTDSPASHNGAAYIFVKSGTDWVQQAKLLASDRANDDGFGISVALSANGNTALVGANVKSDNPTTSNGAAYIFTQSGDVWTQQTKLLAIDKTNSDYFGTSVALAADGNTALIGAYGKSDNPTTSNGAAYIFTQSSGIWTQQTKLLTADKANNDQFGSSVTLSADGNTALVSAGNKSDNPTISNGAAYIFTQSGGTWTQKTKLLASDKGHQDYFGSSVTLSADGNTALVSAGNKSDSPASHNGAAYIFTQSSGIWTQQTKLLANDKASGDYFGYSAMLSTDGNTALIGAVNKSDGPTTSNGAAYIFTQSGGVWTQQTKLLAADRANSDSFGHAVALSANGDIALIGALNRSDSPTMNNGTSYIFVSDSLVPTETATNSATPSLTPTATVTATPTNTLVPPRPDTIGAYKDGIFYLRNTNNSGFADITATFGGDPSDLPVAGDWNGDGVDTIGVYRNNTGFFFLSDSNTAPTVVYTVLFGNPGDTPFTGRWTVDMNGSGIGVYRNSNGILYQRKSLTSGFDDFFAIFGNPGDVGFAGDWDGDGFDSIGIFRPSNEIWYLTNNSTPSGITFSDINFFWHIGLNIPIAGDWDGDGISTVGYQGYYSGNFSLRSANSSTATQNMFTFGPGFTYAIAGKWIAGNKPPVANRINPVTGAVGNNSNDNGRTD